MATKSASDNNNRKKNDKVQDKTAPDNAVQNDETSNIKTAAGKTLTPAKSEARTAALKAAAQRPPYDASKLGDTSTRDLVPAMPTHLSAPGVNLGAYINTVHQIPILTPTQEQELAHRYYDEGDVEAARLLVMSHLRFV
ncbi:sigma-70 factor domain-containing protein, partial [Psychrobacter sp. T6-1]|uniref:sigma-70 factor domain-containing protein n=1 Tax=Psychrobacter sp. T6-1 TaxID=3457447 RepID=UPI003FD18776